jgi:subtilisin family serine protease
VEFEEHTGVHVWAGHGNFVAGLIRQAAPAAHLDMRAGLAPDTGTSSAWEVAKKIASFQHSGIHILNLSLGCVTADNEPPLVLRRALEKLDPQVLVVAAAGNRANADFPPAQVWPAAATGVIAVGAVDQGGALAEFCLDKAWTRCFAPGVAVTSTYLTDTVTLDDGEEIEFTGTAEWSGTSFATAAVTGKIAARMTADDVSARDALCLVLHDATSQVTLRPKDPDA